MNKELLRFFRDLTEAPGPSGFEQPVQEVFRAFVRPHADELRTDVHGNVIASRHGSGKVRLMLAAHVDEVGLMVNHIDDQGMLSFRRIGGAVTRVLPGLRVTIMHQGRGCRGIIGGATPYPPAEDDGKLWKEEDLWIDIGAASKKEAETLVAVGDCATYSPGLELLANQRVVTKAADNRAGVFVLGALLKQLAGKGLAANLHVVSSVQEEIGLRGATTCTYAIAPDVGLAVDVAHATDLPGMNHKVMGEIRLGGGPVISLGANTNPRVLTLLEQAAAKGKIPHQRLAAPYGTSTDANIIQISRQGVATGLVSIPLRYLHTPNEVVSLRDMERTVSLLAHFVQLIDDHTDFTPGV